MRREEYLYTLTEQIRCKMARGTIEQEINDHIEDQKAEFLSEGMSQTEAEEAAVREMGDPVEVGLEMDRIHRPTMAWGMIALIVGLSIALGSNLVSAHDKSEQPEQKFYKSIEIKEGDTLWGIAKEYRGDDYDSIYDYIDEVMSINGLTSDQIHAGQYLTVAYYDTQAR